MDSLLPSHARIVLYYYCPKCKKDVAYNFPPPDYLECCKIPIADLKFMFYSPNAEINTNRSKLISTMKNIGYTDEELQSLDLDWSKDLQHLIKEAVLKING